MAADHYIDPAEAAAAFQRPAQHTTGFVHVGPAAAPGYPDTVFQATTVRLICEATGCPGSYAPVPDTFNVYACDRCGRRVGLGDLDYNTAQIILALLAGLGHLRPS